LLWALAGALEPWPEGREWREVAASEARLPLMLAVESRLAARRSTLEAGGVTVRGGEAKRSRKTAARSSKSATAAIWVPGLPFETSRNLKRGRAPKKKNRR